MNGFLLLKYKFGPAHVNQHEHRIDAASNTLLLFPTGDAPLIFAILLLSILPNLFRHDMR